MTTSPMGFSFRNETAESLEIEIFDAIGKASWWGDTVSSKGVRAKLKEAKSVKTINLRINSVGGDVFEGFAIYNMLEQHSAKVVAHVDALAASIASVICMAADEIHVAQNAFVMIHNPWTPYASGESDDLRKTAAMLDKLREEIATAYVERTGQTRAKVLQLMADTTWLTAAEAKELGFADVIKPAKSKPAGESSKKNARASNAVAFLNLADLKNVPEELRERVESARQSFEGPQTDMQTPITQPASRAEVQETNRMTVLATILAALGGIEESAATARVHQLLRIENAIGATGDEAQGLVVAFKASHAEIADVRAQLSSVTAENTKLKSEGELTQLETAIAEAKAASKLTAAIETDIRAQYASKDLTLKGALFALKNLSPIAALANSGKQPAAPEQAAQGNAGNAPTWNGKTWDELKPMQRLALKDQDPALFASMRTAAGLT